jgi:protein tyrosine/serine phosphatase
MNPIRPLPLPATIPGRLYLHSMPGRDETIPEFITAAKALGIDTIFCLASTDEIHKKSSEYGKSLAAGTMPFTHISFPIPDLGIPDDMEAFQSFVYDMARMLEAGTIGLLHCGAGKSRTGMVAHCVLVELGVSPADADAAVRKAGSGSETPEQRSLVGGFRRR